MNLLKLINEEQLLDVCLTLVSLNEKSFDGPAGMIITAYAARELSSNGKDFTEEELTEKINELIVNKTLENLVNDGEFEVDFSGEEILYRRKDN